MKVRSSDTGSAHGAIRLLLDQLLVEAWWGAEAAAAVRFPCPTPNLMTFLDGFIRDAAQKAAYPEFFAEAPPVPPAPSTAELAARYSVVVRWSDEDNEYVATSPEVQGISGLAPTRGGAVAELETALVLAIEVLLADGKPLPTSSVTFRDIP